MPDNVLNAIDSEIEGLRKRLARLEEGTKAHCWSAPTFTQGECYSSAKASNCIITTGLASEKPENRWW